MLPSAPWSLLDESDVKLRDHLTNFWIHAPSDQLENLWVSPVGNATYKLVASLSHSHVFTDDQIALRSDIGAYFNDNGLTDPLSANFLLANFLLSPPGLLRINNVEQFFAPWLSQIYSDLYESSGTDDSNDIPESLPSPPSLEFGPFPTTLSDLVANRIHLNRLLGLSNLYYIDPEDREICSELLEIRSSLASAIQLCPESELENIWSTDLGDRYWSLVRSGIQQEPLSELDQKVKADAIASLNPDCHGGFGTPGAINSFLISMMYFLPGSMKVDDAVNKIPSWLYPYYSEIFAASIAS